MELGDVGDDHALVLQDHEAKRAAERGSGDEVDSNHLAEVEHDHAPRARLRNDCGQLRLTQHSRELDRIG